MCGPPKGSQSKEVTKAAFSTSTALTQHSAACVGRHSADELSTARGHSRHYVLPPKFQVLPRRHKHLQSLEGWAAPFSSQTGPAKESHGSPALASSCFSVRLSFQQHRNAAASADKTSTMTLTASS